MFAKWPPLTCGFDANRPAATQATAAGTCGACVQLRLLTRAFLRNEEARRHLQPKDNPPPPSPPAPSDSKSKQRLCLLARGGGTHVV